MTSHVLLSSLLLIFCFTFCKAAPNGVRTGVKHMQGTPTIDQVVTDRHTSIERVLDNLEYVVRFNKDISEVNINPNALDIPGKDETDNKRIVREAVKTYVNHLVSEHATFGYEAGKIKGPEAELIAEILLEKGDQLIGVHHGTHHGDTVKEAPADMYYNMVEKLHLVRLRRAVLHAMSPKQTENLTFLIHLLESLIKKGQKDGVKQIVLHKNVIGEQLVKADNSGISLAFKNYFNWSKYTNTPPGMFSRMSQKWNERFADRMADLGLQSRIKCRVSEQKPEKEQEEWLIDLGAEDAKPQQQKESEYAKALEGLTNEAQETTEPEEEPKKEGTESG